MPTFNKFKINHELLKKFLNIRKPLGTYSDKNYNEWLSYIKATRKIEYKTIDKTKIVYFTDKTIAYPIFSNINNVEKVVYEMYLMLQKLYGNSQIGFLICGTSGLMMGTIIRKYIKNCNLIYVKKDFETSHTDRKVLFDKWSPNEKYIILDDFIDSGHTIIHIIKYATEIYPELKVDAICTCTKDLNPSNYELFMKEFPNLTYFIKSTEYEIK